MSPSSSISSSCLGGRCVEVFDHLDRLMRWGFNGVHLELLAHAGAQVELGALVLVLPGDALRVPQLDVVRPVLALAARINVQVSVPLFLRRLAWRTGRPAGWWSARRRRADVFGRRRADVL